MDMMRQLAVLGCILAFFLSLILAQDTSTASMATDMMTTAENSTQMSNTNVTETTMDSNSTMGSVGGSSSVVSSIACIIGAALLTLFY